MIEERLGRAGRPFAMLVIVAVGCAVIAWAYSIVATKLVDPLTFPIRALFGFNADRMYTIDLYFFTRLATYFTISIIFLVAFHIVTIYFYKRDIKKLELELDEYKRKYDDTVSV